MYLSCLYLLYCIVQILLHPIPCPVCLYSVSFVVAHMPLQLLVRSCLGNLLYLGMTAVLFSVFVGGMSESTLTSLESRLTPCHEIILPKNRILVHLKRHLSLLSFTFACLHTQSTFSNGSLWS